MIDKYYTPEIEEFHIGFEYEVKGLKEWNKKIVSSSQDILEMEELMMRSLNPYRVKYLDKEDIESLGFESSGKAVCNWYKIEGKFEDSFSSYGYWTKIRLVHCKENKAIKIIAYEFSWDEEDSVLFAGTIKNKSELKKLLKQLNINDNN